MSGKLNTEAPLATLDSGLGPAAGALAGPLATAALAAAALALAATLAALVVPMVAAAAVGLLVSGCGTRRAGIGGIFASGAFSGGAAIVAPVPMSAPLAPLPLP